MSPAGDRPTTPGGRRGRLLGFGLAFLGATVALTWLLEHAVPPPYSGFLAAVVVGLVATEVVRRQPRQRAFRMFLGYLAARERGADEAAARERLLLRLTRDPALRQRRARDVEAAWTGSSEKERALGGVRVLLAHHRQTLEPQALDEVYERARDRFTIPDWSSLPPPFVDAVRGRLEPPGQAQLDALSEKYSLLRQKFFKHPMSLATDPAASVTDFARLLHSLGNRLAKDEPGDAERAYRLSLRLRPADNLAHAGLALLLSQTGRTREATQEAKVALEVLQAYAARAADAPPTSEDISPFRSPKSLREALERAATGAGG